MDDAALVLQAAAKPVPGRPASEPVRRILELLVPLSQRPALKAGMLELRAAGVTARVLHMLLQRCGCRRSEVLRISADQHDCLL